MKCISFDEIISYHPDNKRIFDKLTELIKSESILPFIGAGLSAFIYSPWIKFLNGISEKIYSEDKKEQYRKLIESYKYEEAASLLEKERGKANFEQDIIDEFNEEKLKSGDFNKTIGRQAVFLLPFLFKGLVVTTNFDRVLSKVYELNGTPFGENIGHPGHRELLMRVMRRGDILSLYKFHGDVGEPGKLVLTKEKYDKNYGDGSDLSKELSKCFTEKCFLFLGCSLNQDRTMNVLSGVLDDGIVNYAITDCEEDKREERSRELGNMGIQTILYPKGQHNSVRVLLERLLEVTDHDAYEGLNYYEGKTEPLSQNRFVYTSGSVGFFGRDKETRKLEEFCYSRPVSPLKWWAVTGEGGSGKSRLVYEFEKSIRPDWAVVRPYPYDFGGLSKTSDNIQKKTLFVLDYVQYYAKDIGKWIETLYKSSSTIQKRIILIEREGNSINDAQWAKQLKEEASPLALSETCYSEGFLAVEAIKKEHTLNIIGDYAERLGRNLHVGEPEELYKKLEQIDPGLCRPLYALFITDAYIENRDALKWDRKKVLDYITDREEGIYRRRMREGIHDCSGLACNSFIEMKAMATALGGLIIPGEAEKVCGDEWNNIKRMAEKNIEEPESMLYNAGLLENKEGSLKLTAFQPDITGEYYVLRRMLDNKVEAEEFIKRAWIKPVDFVFFIYRLFRDHSRILLQNERIAKAIIRTPKIEDEDIMIIYTMILINIAGYSEGTLAEYAVSLQKEVTKKYDNPEIKTSYARGMVNIVNNQDTESALGTVKELKSLAKEYKTIPEFIIRYSQGLLNLLHKQNVEDASDTVKELRVLAEEHEEIPDILITYVNGMAKLSYEQDMEGKAKTVVKLRGLVEEHKDIPEIITAYAAVLAELLKRQEINNLVETVKELSRLAEDHKDNQMVIEVYAIGLGSLFKEQETEDKETINKIKELMEDHKDILTIKNVYALGLAYKIVKQWEGWEEANKELDEILGEHPEMSELSMIYQDIKEALSNSGVKKPE